MKDFVPSHEISIFNRRHETGLRSFRWEACWLSAGSAPFLPPLWIFDFWNTIPRHDHWWKLYCFETVMVVFWGFNFSLFCVWPPSVPQWRGTSSWVHQCFSLTTASLISFSRVHWTRAWGTWRELPQTCRWASEPSVRPHVLVGATWLASKSHLFSTE